MNQNKMLSLTALAMFLLLIGITVLAQDGNVDVNADVNADANAGVDVNANADLNDPNALPDECFSIGPPNFDDADLVETCQKLSLGGCVTPNQGGGHCLVNTDWSALRNGDLVLTYGLRWEPDVAVGIDGNTWVVPLFTTMFIENISQYVAVCIDGATAYTAPHGVDIYVDGERVVKNWRTHGRGSCFGGYVVRGQERPMSYQFNVPGFHYVRLIFDTQINGMCSKNFQDGEFAVIVEQPLISVNGSDNKILKFTEEESEPQTTYVTWTIRNPGSLITKVKSVTPTGCENGISCEILGFGIIPDYDVDWEVVAQATLDDGNIITATQAGTGDGNYSITLIPPDENRSIEFVEILSVTPIDTISDFNSVENADGSHTINGDLNVMMQTDVAMQIDPKSDPEGNDTLILIQKVTASKPSASVANNYLGLNVEYTDSYDAFTLTKEEESKVRISRLWAEEQKFHVELVGGLQDMCIGKDGRLGGTGPGEVPKVLPKWGWDSIGTETCNRESKNDAEFAYCDPTQFTIQLLKRLNEMYNYAAQGDFSSAATMEHFQAYLIGDNINADFRRDFDYYYKFETNAFDTYSWYDDEATPWDKYVTDFGHLTFEPGAYTTGLYSVAIEFEFMRDKYQFFREGELTSNIKVKLSKIRSPYFKSPFYYIPFNGEVGYYRLDEELDGTIGRKGYGVGYVGDIITIDEGGFIETEPGLEGEMTVTTAYEQGLDKLNIENRGVVLSVLQTGNDNFDIEFSPSNATPVIMKIEGGGEDRVDGYYYLVDSAAQGDSVESPYPYMSLWTGFASDMSCLNFDGNALYYRRPDMEGTPAAGAAPEVNYFGFSWQGVEGDNQAGILAMQTAFYIPSSKVMTINTDPTLFGNVQLMGPSEASNSFALNYKQLESNIGSVFELIRQDYICVSLEDNALEFWWNPQRLEQDLETVRQANIPESVETCASGVEAI